MPEMRPCRLILYPPLDKTDGEGKFLQLIWRGVEYLLFANRETHRFHNQMLAQFLTESGVPHTWVDDQSLEVDDEQLEVIGGGRFRLNRSRGLLELWDNSTAYGRFDEHVLENQIHTAGPPWDRIEVSIR